MSTMDPPSTAPAPPATGPEPGDNRLRGGSLGLLDIASSTMANIGPAMSFYFGFGLLATTAGVASPLTIVVAGLTVALLGNTLAQFSRAHPSAGGFITFVGKTFGPTSAVTTALLVTAGYIIAMASVIAISGGFLEMTLNYYFGWNVPWILFTLVLTGLAVVLMVRGVGVSTRSPGTSSRSRCGAGRGVGGDHRQARRAPVAQAVHAQPRQGRHVRAR